MMEKTVRRGTRTGFTTGACSAAAAAAAVQGLVHGAVPDAVDCLLPNGDTVRFAVNDGRCDVSTADAPATAHAMVIKDAGDDPDCTDKAHLTADVRLLPGEAGVVRLAVGAKQSRNINRTRHSGGHLPRHKERLKLATGLGVSFVQHEA